MIAINRSEAPIELSDNYVRWTQRFVERRTENPGAEFFWNTINGVTINKIILPVLLNDTNGHCSYCDSFPLLNSNKTIDHFFPKSDYPQDAYNWANLYVACRECQDNKGVIVSDDLLRPDVDDYNFNNFFIINFTEFKLEPNPMSSEDFQTKAETTIRILDLNSIEFQIARRHSYTREKDENSIIEDFAFRYLFN